MTAEQAYVSPLAALILSAGLTAWLVRKPSLLADVPNERSLHVQAVPRTGGIAIVAGVLAGLSLIPGTQVLLATAAGVAVVSLLDDYRSLPVVVRLAAHFIAAIAFLLAQALDGPTAESIAFVLALVWLANLYNFMDGSDGLAGGMAIIGFGAYALAAWLGGHWVLACVGATIAAATLPFLAFNLHPARLFMGDAGSVTLGFLAASVGLIGWQAGTWSLIFPLLVFSPFIADATLTLVRRVLKKEKFWRAHREHYYQKLVMSGLGHDATARVEYLAMLLASGLAISVLGETIAFQFATAAGWYAALGLSARLVERRWQRYGSGGSS